MATMDRTTTTAVNDIYNIRKLLTIARSKLAFTMFGQEDEIAMRSGDTVKWFSVGDLTTQTATINDSATAKKDAATVTTITSQLSLYGNDLEYVENLDITSVIDLPPVLLERIGRNAGASIDGIVKTVVLAGATQVHYAGSTTTATITSANYATYTDIVDVVRKLEDQDAPKFVHGKTGEEVYIALISPALKARFLKDSTFRDIAKSQNADRFFRGELATIDGVAFCVTTELKNSTSTVNSTTCDQAIVLGRGAYGVSGLPLAGGGAKVMNDPTTYQPDNAQWTEEMITKMFEVVITPPGGHGDVYKQKTAIAWKSFFTSKVLNANFMVKFVSAR